jgi:hypothetical protein
VKELSVTVVFSIPLLCCPNKIYLMVVGVNVMGGGSGDGDGWGEW